MDQLTDERMDGWMDGQKERSISRGKKNMWNRVILLVRDCNFWHFYNSLRNEEHVIKVYCLCDSSKIKIGILLVYIFVIFFALYITKNKFLAFQ